MVDDPLLDADKERVTVGMLGSVQRPASQFAKPAPPCSKPGPNSCNSDLSEHEPREFRDDIDEEEGESVPKLHTS